MTFTVPVGLAQAGRAKARQLIPLSEDQSLVLIDPEMMHILSTETRAWHELVELRIGETRVLKSSISLADGATGLCVQIFDVPETATLTLLQEVQVGAVSSWRHVVIVRGEGRIEIRRQVHAAADRAKAELVCVGRGTRAASFSVSDEILSDASNTQAEIHTKISLNDMSRSEVRARLRVNEQSVGGEFHERIDHLLLGDGTQAAAIPELEVKTHDVRCGHGATTSRPQATDLFYLMSRGLSASEADQLLEASFLGDLLQAVPESIQTQAFRVIWR